MTPDAPTPSHEFFESDRPKNAKNDLAGTLRNLKERKVKVGGKDTSLERIIRDYLDDGVVAGKKRTLEQMKQGIGAFIEKEMKDEKTRGELLARLGELSDLKSLAMEAGILVPEEQPRDTESRELHGKSREELVALYESTKEEFAEAQFAMKGARDDAKTTKTVVVRGRRGSMKRVQKKVDGDFKKDPAWRAARAQAASLQKRLTRVRSAYQDVSGETISRHYAWKKEAKGPVRDARGLTGAEARVLEERKSEEKRIRQEREKEADFRERLATGRARPEELVKYARELYPNATNEQLYEIAKGMARDRRTGNSPAENHPSPSQ